MISLMVIEILDRVAIVLIMISRKAASTFEAISPIVPSKGSRSASPSIQVLIVSKEAITTSELLVPFHVHPTGLAHFASNSL